MMVPKNARHLRLEQASDGDNIPCLNLCWDDPEGDGNLKVVKMLSHHGLAIHDIKDYKIWDAISAFAFWIVGKMISFKQRSTYPYLFYD
jgi:hypothetical protein